MAHNPKSTSLGGSYIHLFIPLPCTQRPRGHSWDVSFYRCEGSGGPLGRSELGAIETAISVYDLSARDTTAYAHHSAFRGDAPGTEIASLMGANPHVSRGTHPIVYVAEGILVSNQS